jgi:hypothetical protein
VVCGCSLPGGDDDPAPAAKGEPKPGARGGPGAAGKAAPPSGEPAEGRTIRAWSAAVNAGDFFEAASFFARGAIVEQGEVIRLRDRGEAIQFNSSLPCRAQVTDVDDEGRTILAAFRLLPGRAGGCRGGGTARVRFRFEHGKFKEWRQLDEGDRPPSQIA